MSVRIMVGDCRTRLLELADSSVQSCVTDPPYHLTSIVKRFGAANAAPAKVGATGAYARAARGFMGQTWDGGDVAFDPATWEAIYRVLTPGAHLVAFSGTRTYHRMACAIEDAGFEIRDQLAWIYGSGFPKSHNLPDDGEWAGWGTALKPAWEPICFARKPLGATVAASMAAHRTGAINVDACRVDAPEGKTPGGRGSSAGAVGWQPSASFDLCDGRGRFPANLLHDGSDEVIAAFPESAGQMGAVGPEHGNRETVHCYGDFGPRPVTPPRGDTGSAARFFYAAKASKADRGNGNIHPTVKPIDLMQWLCRLVTPPGGTVLDPFAGSGSTLVAADAEQFNAIGCELSADYAAIAAGRVRDRAGMFADVQVAA